MRKLHAYPTEMQPPAAGSDPPDDRLLADDFIPACITRFLDELGPRMNLRLGRHVPATPVAGALCDAVRALTQVQREIDTAAIRR